MHQTRLFSRYRWLIDGQPPLPVGQSNVEPHTWLGYYILWLRLGSAPGARLPLALSVIGVILLSISGWLGGEMVFKHGVAVEPRPDTKPSGRDARAA